MIIIDSDLLSNFNQLCLLERERIFSRPGTPCWQCACPIGRGIRLCIVQKTRGDWEKMGESINIT